MSATEPRSSLRDWMARVGATLRGPGAGAVPAGDDLVHPSKALPRFFAAMRTRPAPVLLDLGPVIGGNVTLLGESLGCKVYIDNIFGDPERAARDRRESEDCSGLSADLRHPDDSIDGVLCWDVFEYLSQPAASKLVLNLARILKPGGVGMAIFSTERPEHPQFVKYFMVDERHLRHRVVRAAVAQPRVWTSRDVQLGLASFAVDESFLLTHRQRETLFHKPGPSGAAGT